MRTSRVVRAIEPIDTAPSVHALRAGRTASPEAHLTVLLFVAILLGVFGTAWPLAEASVGACEYAHLPAAAGPTIGAAGSPLAPEAPLPATPNGLDWLGRSRTDAAIVQMNRFTGRIRLTSSGRPRRGLGHAAADLAARSDLPRVSSTHAPAGHVRPDGVLDVYMLPSRGPPAGGRRPALSVLGICASHGAVVWRISRPARSAFLFAACAVVSGPVVPRHGVQFVRDQRGPSAIWNERPSRV